MNLSPALAGFIKGVLMVVLFGVITYLEDANHLTGVVSPTVAAVVVALASSLESHLKAQSGGTTALFGAVRVK